MIIKHPERPREGEFETEIVFCWFPRFFNITGSLSGGITVWLEFIELEWQHYYTKKDIPFKRLTGYKTGIKFCQYWQAKFNKNKNNENQKQN